MEICFKKIARETWKVTSRNNFEDIYIYIYVCIVGKTIYFSKEKKKN